MVLNQTGNLKPRHPILPFTKHFFMLQDDNRYNPLDLTQFNRLLAADSGIPEAIVLGHKKILQSNSFEEGHSHSASLLSVILRIYQGDPSKPSIHSYLRTICHNHWILGQHAKCLEETARGLVKVFGPLIALFRLTLSSSSDDTKSLGFGLALGSLLALTNLLIKTYYRLKNGRLGEHLLRAVVDALPSGTDLLQLAESKVITYQDAMTFLYYRARVLLLHSKFGEAEALLWPLYQMTRKLALPRHAHRVLIHLVPLRIVVHGLLPCSKVLHDALLNGLYGPLVDCLKTGNLVHFASYLKDKMAFFLSHELFLLMTVDMQWLMYRRLIKLTYSACKGGLLADPSRLPTDIILYSFNHFQNSNSNLKSKSNVDQDNTEAILRWDIVRLECILANLIHKGLLRAYISGDKSVMVLSRLKPFPPLHTAA